MCFILSFIFYSAIVLYSRIKGAVCVNELIVVFLSMNCKYENHVLRNPKKMGCTELMLKTHTDV